jgi:hypothetical protein
MFTSTVFNVVLRYMSVPPNGYSRIATEDPDDESSVNNTNNTSSVVEQSPHNSIPHTVTIRPLYPGVLPVTQLTENTTTCLICSRPFPVSSSDLMEPTWSRYCPNCIIGTCRGCGSTFQRSLSTHPTDCNFYRCSKCRLSSFKVIANSCSLM